MIHSEPKCDSQWTGPVALYLQRAKSSGNLMHCTSSIYPIEDSLHCTLTLKNWNILLSFSSIVIFHIFHAQSCLDWKCWRKALFDAIQSGSMSCEKCGTADASRPCNVSLPAFWQISIQSQTSILTNVFPNKYFCCILLAWLYTHFCRFMSHFEFLLSFAVKSGSRQSWQRQDFERFWNINPSRSYINRKI